MKMTILVGTCLEKKTMLVWVKKYIRKNFVTCKNLCYLQELHATFKEKQPNVYIRFSKFCTLRPKWRVLAVCVCSAHQNFMLLVDAMEWDLTYKDLIKKIICNPDSNKCIMHRCCIGVNPVPALQFSRNFSIRNSRNMKMMRNLITVRGTLPIEPDWQPLQPLTKNTKRLWLMSLMI